MLLLILVHFFLIQASIESTIDFTESDKFNNWQIINDGVMGGLSQGKIRFNEEGMVFSGFVSLENNGGFTSFRSPFQHIDLSGFESIQIKYKSSGLDCAISFDRSRRFWRPNHKLKLPVSSDWTTLNIPLSQLNEYRMGNLTGDQMSQEDLSQIIRIGFITDSKSAGEFSLQVAYIKFSSQN